MCHTFEARIPNGIDIPVQTGPIHFEDAWSLKEPVEIRYQSFLEMRRMYERCGILFCFVHKRVKASVKIFIISCVIEIVKLRINFKSVSSEMALCFKCSLMYGFPIAANALSSRITIYIQANILLLAGRQIWRWMRRSSVVCASARARASHSLCALRGCEN